MFHHLSQKSPDLISGRNLARAYAQVYRSIEHGIARAACLECRNKGDAFPAAIPQYADTFLDLQEARHRADYDPSGVFNLSQAMQFVSRGAAAISAFDAEPEHHQRALVVLVAIRKRGCG